MSKIYKEAARRSYTARMGKQAWSLEDEALMKLRLWVLEQCRGSRTQTAIILGVAMRTLRLQFAKYKELGIDIAPPPRSGFGGNSVQLPESFWPELMRRVNGSDRIER